MSAITHVLLLPRCTNRICVTFVPYGWAWYKTIPCAVWTPTILCVIHCTGATGSSRVPDLPQSLINMVMRRGVYTWGNDAFCVTGNVGGSKNLLVTWKSILQQIPTIKTFTLHINDWKMLPLGAVRCVKMSLQLSPRPFARFGANGKDEWKELDKERERKGYNIYGEELASLALGGERRPLVIGARAIFSRGLSHLRPKNFSTAPEKTPMLTCKNILPDWGHPVIISKNLGFRALYLTRQNEFRFLV